MHILSFSDALKARFGTKVYKLSLSAGCTCPNRDGTLGTGGCTFCSAGGSGEFAAPPAPIGVQIAAAKKRVDPKFPKRIPPKDRRYLAYFQSYTNTYGDPERLAALWRAAAAPDDIVGLSVGTRPDCLPPTILDALAAVNRTKPVWVELGLQTIHPRTARAIRRGYALPVFEQAYRDLTDRGIAVVVHVILGLPGESRDDMLATVRYLAKLAPALAGIKLQLLHVLKGTALAEQYAADPFPLFSLDDYCGLVVDCLKLLPRSTAVHRLTGDGPKRLLIAPLWSADKRRVMNALRAAIARA
jgi:radical SAM protein (TIGR01212 family)